MTIRFFISLNFTNGRQQLRERRQSETDWTKAAHHLAGTGLHAHCQVTTEGICPAVSHLGRVLASYSTLMRIISPPFLSLFEPFLNHRDSTFVTCVVMSPRVIASPAVAFLSRRVEDKTTPRTTDRIEADNSVAETPDNNRTIKSMPPTIGSRFLS